MDRSSLKAAGALLAALFSHVASAQICPQNFDGVTAPALPAGWSTSAAGAGTVWVTTTSSPDTAPNTAFAGDMPAVGDSYLVSPPTLIDENNSTITFHHHYQTESTFDGGVLEIAISGPFEDIVDAGGTLVIGGYNGTISDQFMSPIAGRMAWTGDSGGFVTTIANLPPSAVGAIVQLRWRMASDKSVSATGWSVDSILCGSHPPPVIQLPWIYGPPYPIPILDEATTAMDGTLYSFGGVSASVIIPDAYKFDGSVWTPIAALPEALEFPYAVNDGTNIFIIGGARTDGTASNTLYRYTPSTDSYQAMAPFATAAWTVAAAVVDGKIVKFGGNLTPSGTTTATEIYDIATDTWSPGGDYPFALGFISAFTHDGFVYGAGGIDAASVVRANTYRYDMATNTWDDAPIANLPDVRWGSATIETPEGVIMAGGYVGGSGTGNLSTSSIAWDAATNTWQSFDALTLARARMTGAMLGRSPIVIGGRSSAGGFAGTVEVQIHDHLFASGFDAAK